MAIHGQNNTDRYADVLYHLIRAASYEGKGSLPPEARQALDKRLVEISSSIEQGTPILEEIRKTARVNPMPPPGFRNTVTAARGEKAPSVRAVEVREIEPPDQEDFETVYRRSISGKRAFLADIFRGISASFANKPFVSVRDQMYQEWLDQQKLKLLRQGAR